MTSKRIQETVASDFERDPPSYSLFLVNDCYSDLPFGKNENAKKKITVQVDEVNKMAFGTNKKTQEEKDKLKLKEAEEKKLESRGFVKKDECDENSGNGKFMEKLRHFTSHTTLHGLKYVFDSHPLRIRGIVWLTCVVGCLCLFAYQAIERTLIYFQYPSNVNVEIVYVPSLEFPAVTICNYNKHRLSAVFERNMYDFMNKIHKGQEENLIETLPLPFSVIDASMTNLNITEFMLSTAHQLNDFIVGCKWRNQYCDISKNFSIMFTDLGVCYAFNADTVHRSHVTKSGSRSGLSIMLNVEQYEYMNGPDHESGIKILLHDPREVPQVRDLGFAVSPGTYGLVGVNRQVVENLPSPYGVCYTNVSFRSECLAQCVSDEIFRRCGCRDFNMKPPRDSKDKVCTFGASFFCVRENLVLTSQMTSNQCHCPAPCSKITYDPILSYAQISQVDFKQVTNRDASLDVARIKNNYERARVISENVDKLNKGQNSEMIYNFLNALNLFRASITSNIKAFNQLDNYLYQRFSVNTLYVRNYSSISGDLYALNTSFSLKIPLFSTPQPDISNWITTINDDYRGISAFLDVNLSPKDSGLIWRLTDCLQADDAELASSCVDDNPNKPTYLYFQKNILEKWLQYAQLTLDWLNQIDQNYNMTVTRLFENTGFNYEKKEEHIKCLSTLSSIKVFWKPLLQNLTDVQRPIYLLTKNTSEKLQVAKEFQSFYVLTKGPNKISREVLDPCYWFIQVRWVDENYTSFANTLNTALHVLSIVTPLESSIQHEMQDISSVLEESTHPLVKALKDFLSFKNNLTKYSLAKIFEEKEAQAIENLITVQVTSCVKEFNQLANKLYDLCGSLKNFYNKSFHLVVPAANDQLIARLELIKTAQKMVDEKKDPVLKKHLAGITIDRCQSVVGIVHRVFSKYKDAVQDLQRITADSSRNLHSTMDVLKKDLKAYVQKGALDHDFVRENFIKVDIFYKDLSYDHVQQQVSFQSLSLFSEIGGFLGLLLGASVLTLVEFVDFFTMLCVGYAKKKK